MAYVYKEVIAAKREALKAVNKKYGMKTSLSGANTLSMNCVIVSGEIDLIENSISVLMEDHTFNHGRGFSDTSAGNMRKDKNIQVNHYYLDSSFDGIALEYLKAVKAVLFDGHVDNSDTQSDYFDVTYYVHMEIGRWNKPYTLNQK